MKVFFIFQTLFLFHRCLCLKILDFSKRKAAAILLSTGMIVDFSLLLPSISLAGDTYPQEVLERKRGTTSVEGEEERIFRKARQVESDGDFNEAKELYEQLVEVDPDFIYGWANLGNVLTSLGNLEDALLCYKKAISLLPPKDSLSVILVNRAAIELSLGRSADSVRDLNIAEKLSGPLPGILTNKAVALTNIGEWDEACSIFEKVISTADKNALPWWLRYSMALLETGRGVEGVAFLQRTLNRFPDETECKAFASVLYSTLGSPVEALRYWNSIPENDKALYSSKGFVANKLHWGPVAVQNYEKFLSVIGVKSL